MVLAIRIYGENHFNPISINKINDSIKQFKPDILLHELLYEDECLTIDEIKNRLGDCKKGGICDPELNKDIYLIGLELSIPIIGIDNETYTKITDLNKQFKLREAHMLQKIQNVIKSDKYNKIAVVVGNIHIRETGEFGPSVIYEALKPNPKIKFIPFNQKESPNFLKWSK